MLVFCLIHHFKRWGKCGNLFLFHDTLICYDAGTSIKQAFDPQMTIIGYIKCKISFNPNLAQPYKTLQGEVQKMRKVRLRHRRGYHIGTKSLPGQ